MPTIHLFNPENDLALATNEPHYTPRSRAAALARAGALLPAWWAEENDLICANPFDIEKAKYIEREFGLNCNIYTSERDIIDRCDPWGWSSYTKVKLREIGIPESVLPDDNTINSYRAISNRLTARKINKYIIEHTSGCNLPELALITDSADSAISHIYQADKRTYVKSPWSSSGRGVFPTWSMDEKTLRRQIDGIIRRQGTITVEHALDKVLDFAALYECREHKARFLGWSVFNTLDRCAYLGNIIAPQSYLEEYICSHLTGSTKLNYIRKTQEDAINSLISPFYDGVLGVDMMIYRNIDRSKDIAPCIEVNLRHTMGMVALAIGNRLEINSPALFKIEYSTNRVDDKNVINLLPPSDGFRFLLYQNVCNNL